MLVDLQLKEKRVWLQILHLKTLVFRTTKTHTQPFRLSSAPF